MDYANETMRDLTGRGYSRDEASEVIRLALPLAVEKARGLNPAGELKLSRQGWAGCVAEAKDLFVLGQR